MDKEKKRYILLTVAFGLITIIYIVATFINAYQGNMTGIMCCVISSALMGVLTGLWASKVIAYDYIEFLEEENIKLFLKNSELHEKLFQKLKEEVFKDER